MQDKMSLEQALAAAFPGQHFELGEVETLELPPQDMRWRARVRRAVFNTLVRWSAKLQGISEIQVIAQIMGKRDSETSRG